MQQSKYKPSSHSNKPYSLSEEFYLTQQSIRECLTKCSLN